MVPPKGQRFTIRRKITGLLLLKCQPQGVLRQQLYVATDALLLAEWGPKDLVEISKLLSLSETLYYEFAFHRLLKFKQIGIFRCKKS